LNPSLALCAHLRSDSLASLRCEPRDVIDWDDGPVLAAARCPACGGAALLELLDWSRSRRVRVFALAAIDPAAVALFQKNCGRGSCDLARAGRELEALLFSAGPVERLVALDADTGEVVASAPREPGVPLPSGPFRERVLPEGDTLWFSRLGLAKTAL
jgi:hypothetical protein